MAKTRLNQPQKRKYVSNKEALPTAKRIEQGMILGKTHEWVDILPRGRALRRIKK
jgi:hypothetical protein